MFAAADNQGSKVYAPRGSQKQVDIIMSSIKADPQVGIPPSGLHFEGLDSEIWLVTDPLAFFDVRLSFYRHLFPLQTHLLGLAEEEAVTHWLE